VAIFGVSCPSTSLCVAVGGNDTVASSSEPTGGGASWKSVYPGKGAVQTRSKRISNGREVRGVSCPSANLCVAVSFEGDVYATSDPTGSASAWTDTDTSGTGPNTHFSGVSCPTTALCVAVSEDGQVATSTDPSGGAWSTVSLDDSVRLRGVSCASPSLCVAVGGEQDEAVKGRVLSRLFYSTDPAGGASAWKQTEIETDSGGLFGVACVAAPLCVTGNSGGNLLISSSPTSGSPRWKLIGEPSFVQVTAVSCPTASDCIVVDNNGDILTSTDPTGGASTWTLTNGAPYITKRGEVNANGMFGVSCPSAMLCVVGGARGQIYTSSDPFSTARNHFERFTEHAAEATSSHDR
jgi:hypothetical protein